MADALAGVQSSSGLQALEEFFTLLDQHSRAPQNSPKLSSKTSQSGVEDQLLSLISSGHLEEGLIGIGKAGRDFVVGNFADELKSEVAKELSLPSEERGMLGKAIEWLKDSKVGKALEGTKIGEWFGLSSNSAGAATKGAAAADTALGAVSGVTKSSSLLEGLSSIGTKVMNVAGAAYGVFDLVTNFGNMSPTQGAMSGLAVGAGIGSFFSPAGTLIGGVIGAVAGGIASLFRKSGKHKDQKARDQMRKSLQVAGILDQNWTIGLADGSRYNIGIDGGPKKEFGGRRPYEIDLNDPLSVKISTFLNPLTYIVCGGNEKLAVDLRGYLTNAALSNAGGDESLARANVKAIYEQFKVRPQELVQGTARLTEMGAISAEWGTSFISVLKDLFSRSAWESGTANAAKQ